MFYKISYWLKSFSLSNREEIMLKRDLNMSKNFLKPQISLCPSFRYGFSILSATNTAFYQYQFCLSFYQYQYQVCLSLYDLSVDTGRQRVNPFQPSSVFHIETSQLICTLYIKKIPLVYDGWRKHICYSIF